MYIPAIHVKLLYATANNSQKDKTGNITPIPLMRKITLLAILLLTASTSFAQMKGGAKKMRLWAGPRIGMNVSNFYSDSAHLYNQVKVSFMGGASVNFSFNNTLSVQTEVNYSPKGGKYRFSTDSSSIRAAYNLTYLDIPLMVQVKGGEDDMKAFFQIGVQMPFLLSAKYSEETTNGAVSSSLSNSNADSLGVLASDFGLVAGFGFTSTSGWCFTLRADLGLTDIPDRYHKIIIHNMVLQASLGFYFGRKYDVIGGR